MPRVRARKDCYIDGVYRKKGDVFDVTDSRHAVAKKRYVDSKGVIDPPFELLGKPKPAEDPSSIA